MGEWQGEVAWSFLVAAGFSKLVSGYDLKSSGAAPTRQHRNSKAATLMRLPMQAA